MNHGSRFFLNGVRLDGGFNTYAYVGGDPIRFVDPSGLINPVKIGVAVGNWITGTVAVITAVIPLAAGNTPLAAWQFTTGALKIKRGIKQWEEAWCEKTSDASLKNLAGLGPFGDKVDDANEPYLKDYLEDRLGIPRQGPRGRPQ
jgi:type VI secretion system secreted protein VgrG